MVIYFKSSVVDPPVTLFMGIDKHENEELLKWGWPEDVWFHVDKHSSAHVYLRLKQGESIEDIPGPVLEDCAQLVKANSIEGNKLNNVDVVYTAWGNLNKTQGMDVGQVGFHKQKQVQKMRVERRTNETVNRLNKTRRELADVDLRQEREDRDREERERDKARLRAARDRERDEVEQRKREAELRNYSSLMVSDNMKSNKDEGGDSDASDDFM